MSVLDDGGQRVGRKGVGREEEFSFSLQWRLSQGGREFVVDSYDTWMSMQDEMREYFARFDEVRVKFENGEMTPKDVTDAGFSVDPVIVLNEEVGEDLKGVYRVLDKTGREIGSLKLHILPPGHKESPHHRGFLVKP